MTLAPLLYGIIICFTSAHQSSKIAGLLSLGVGNFENATFSSSPWKGLFLTSILQAEDPLNSRFSHYIHLNLGYNTMLYHDHRKDNPKAKLFNTDFYYYFTWYFLTSKKIGLSLGLGPTLNFFFYLFRLQVARELTESSYGGSMGLNIKARYYGNKLPLHLEFLWVITKTVSPFVSFHSEITYLSDKDIITMKAIKFLIKLTLIYPIKPRYFSQLETGINKYILGHRKYGSIEYWLSHVYDNYYLALGIGKYL